MKPGDVGNPEAVSPTEKKIYDEFREKIENLLDDLKSNGHLKIPSKAQIKNILNVMQLLDEQAKLLNTINNLFLDKNASERFIEKNEEFGFNDKNVPHLWASQMISVFNMQTEAFKLAFLIMLKISDKNPRLTLGQLKNELVKLSSLAAPVLDEFEIALRNAFTHQLYWFNEGKINYCINVKLDNPKKISLGEVMKQGKRQNILYQAFIRTFGLKASSGFFRGL